MTEVHAMRPLRWSRFRKPRSLGEAFRRAEDFAVDHMASLAMGTGIGIVAIAAILVLDEPAALPQATQGVDRTIVGSIGPTPAASRPQWTPVPKPVEMISLEAPQFQQQPARYAARRASNSDREDALHFESLSANQSEARVALVRRAGEAAAPSLFIEMMRLQSERGVAITRSGSPGPLATKFGELEVADMTFTDGDGRNMSCLAFRTPQSPGRIGLNGWYCAAENATAERPTVGCFIDRLTLLKGGEDMALRRFFTEAEQRRKPCPTPRVAANRKQNWLDAHGAPPAIRGGQPNVKPPAR
ncbi:MAG: hypothetical protein ACRC7C_18045 [Beijerinckiaceae bacterium]